RYGPGDGGALNDFAAPIVERLKWIQAQVAQGASFVGGRVFYSEWVPDGTFGGSYSEDNGKLVKLLPVYVEQRQYLNFDRQQQTGGCPECFIYSNGTKGGEPIIERIDDYPQFSTNWVQYPEGFKFYFDKEFKTLVTNPINPNSYSSLLLALRQSPQYMAGFVNGYNQGYDYYDHVWNNFFNTLAIPLSQMDDSPADEQLLGYYSGFGTGMNDRKNSYPNLLSPKN
ncbi:MAG: hypothetical protein JNL53_02140, partial [Cyclobacteriaceae bacterium]|nr:hypothetical protein [Cyclobacteriaceae bacterium]